MRHSLITLAFLALSATGQTVVNSYIPGITTDGITYFLPRTELAITITATKTTRTPGDFNAYAQRYMRLNNVITSPQTEWKIDQITTEAIGVPDKEKAFSIKLKSNTVAPFATLTKEGILLCVNGEEKQPTPLAALPKPVSTKNTLNPREYFTEEILSAGSTAKMAELTAGEIYDIRESRNLLNKGETDFMPKDGQQLKLMLEGLAKQEEALLQLFKGTTETATYTYRIIYNPTQDTDRDVLFRFSKQLGIVEKDNLAGAPVYIRVTDKQTAPQPVEDPDAKKSKKTKELNDLRYNVPSEVAISIFAGNHEFTHAVYPMGQFGYVEHLGGDLFNKKNMTRVSLHPTNGGLKKIEAASPQQ